MLLKIKEFNSPTHLGVGVFYPGKMPNRYNAKPTHRIRTKYTKAHPFVSGRYLDARGNFFLYHFTHLGKNQTAMFAPILSRTNMYHIIASMFTIFYVFIKRIITL